jgi:hypothetical protein
MATKTKVHAGDVYPIGMRMLCTDMHGYQEHYYFGVVASTTPATVTIQFVECTSPIDNCDGLSASSTFGPIWEKPTIHKRTYKMHRKDDNELRNGNHMSNYQYAKPFPADRTSFTEHQYY